jgi:predicted acetyltransferase
MELIKLWDADVQKAYQLQSSFMENENGFVNAAFGYSFDEFKEYVNMRKEHSQGINLPEGYVADTVFILVDGEHYVGIFNLRHELNDFLRNGAGHIGYAISSDFRKKGYATKGLALVLDKAREIGIEEAYLSVNKDNYASVRSQLNNGAVIHHEDDKEYYTRIKL